MFGRRILVSNLLALAIAAIPLLGSTTTEAADERVVTAAAECLRTVGSDTGIPTVEVTIENRSGGLLHVAYLRSFGTAPMHDGRPTGLRLDAPTVEPVIEIADGASLTIAAPWAGRELKRSDTIVALLVTSAGVFLPACGADEPQRMTYADETAESAAIAVESVGRLESWQAYPALYALLHSDARGAVPYEAVACWYASRFGPPATEETQLVFSTEASTVDSEAWTWGVNGKSYADAVEVTYVQAVGRSEPAEAVESTMHLVREDGVWRWFFGGSAEGLAAMPIDCELPETT